MRRLYRCRWDKKIGGVCGGLSHFFKCDSSLIRLIALSLCIFTAIIPFIVIYLVACLILPQGPSTYVEVKCKKLYRSTKNRKFLGICGGLGEYFKIDSNLLRVGVVVLTFLTGFLPIPFIYFLASGFIPEKPSHAPKNQWV